MLLAAAGGGEVRVSPEERVGGWGTTTPAPREKACGTESKT